MLWINTKMRTQWELNENSMTICSITQVKKICRKFIFVSDFITFMYILERIWRVNIEIVIMEYSMKEFLHNANWNLFYEIVYAQQKKSCIKWGILQFLNIYIFLIVTKQNQKLVLTTKREKSLKFQFPFDYKLQL